MSQDNLPCLTICSYQRDLEYRRALVIRVIQSLSVLWTFQCYNACASQDVSVSISDWVSRPERVAAHLRSDRLLKADSAIINCNNLKMSCDAIKKHNIRTISKLSKKQVWNRWTLSKWTPNQRTWLSMCKGTSPLTRCPFTLLFPGPFLLTNCLFPKLKSADFIK